MKKILSIFAIAFMVLAVSACGCRQTQQTEAEEETTEVVDSTVVVTDTTTVVAQ